MLDKSEVQYLKTVISHKILVLETEIKVLKNTASRYYKGADKDRQDWSSSFNFFSLNEKRDQIRAKQKLLKKLVIIQKKFKQND